MSTAAEVRSTSRLRAFVTLVVFPVLIAGALTIMGILVGPSTAAAEPGDASGRSSSAPAQPAGGHYLLP